MEELNAKLAKPLELRMAECSPTKTPIAQTLSQQLSVQHDSSCHLKMDTVVSISQVFCECFSF